MGQVLRLKPATRCWYLCKRSSRTISKWLQVLGCYQRQFRLRFLYHFLPSEVGC